MTRLENSMLDDIVYARVLISLQKMQLEAEDKRLGDRLARLLDSEDEGSERCRAALVRAWERAARELDLDEADLFGDHAAA